MHRLSNNTLIIILLLIVSCRPSAQKQASKPETKQQTTDNKMDYPLGTFGYDADFFRQQGVDAFVLQRSDQQLLVSTAYQGRVMTSTCQGLSGRSYGWINHDVIAEGKILEHFTPYGGEERFWLGPEGGQYALYFSPGSEFIFDNWKVPKQLDTEAFEMVLKTDTTAEFSKKMSLTNYQNTVLDIAVKRNIQLLDSSSLEELLGTKLPENIDWVAYQTTNEISNIGKEAWTKDKGLISIWLLGMIKATEQTTVIVPFKPGNEKDLGPVVNDAYFGEISAERLQIQDSTILLKGDGMNRGKIGISIARAKPFAGSWDAQHGVLTLIHTQLPTNKPLYVNSMWEYQNEPYKGDVINVYNDGPLNENANHQPTFYELESSSPARPLKCGESLKHKQTTIHLTGDRRQLKQIALKTLGYKIL